MAKDVRGIKHLSSHVHINYTKHKAYMNADLVSVIDFFHQWYLSFWVKMENKR